MAADKYNYNNNNNIIQCIRVKKRLDCLGH